MALLSGELPAAEQVELDCAGDFGDAGLTWLAGGEVAGLLGLARAGPAGAVAGEEGGHEGPAQETPSLPAGPLRIPAERVIPLPVS